MLQRTVKKQILIEGLGLHSGKMTRVVIRPAKPNSGIIFVRTDLPGKPRIEASFQNIISTRLATTIGNGKASVATVEHIMAAISGCSVDNAVVEINGPEVPVLDGSAKGFCSAIDRVGTQNQLQLKPRVILRRKVEVKIDDKWAVATPSNQLKIHASIEWDHPVIGYQEFRYVEGKTPFSQIADARTFGFLRDVESLRRAGLARGGCLDNVIVLDEAKVVNPGGLRYADEFVRHKVLDALGDLSLSGISFQADFRLHRAGHDLHGQLLNAIFENELNYRIVGDTTDSVESEVAEKILQVAAV